MAQANITADIEAELKDSESWGFIFVWRLQDTTSQENKKRISHDWIVLVDWLFLNVEWKSLKEFLKEKHMSEQVEFYERYKLFIAEKDDEKRAKIANEIISECLTQPKGLVMYY